MHDQAQQRVGEMLFLCVVLVWRDLGFGGAGWRAAHCSDQCAPLERASLAVEPLGTVCVSEHRHLIHPISTLHNRLPIEPLCCEWLIWSHRAIE